MFVCDISHLPRGVALSSCFLREFRRFGVKDKNMKRVIIEEVEKYEDEKYVRPVLFKGERTTSLFSRG